MRIADRSTSTALAAFLAVVSCAAAARAADDLAPAISTLGARPPRDGGMWQASGAFRLALVRDRGFDPFSSNDVLPQVSVSVMRAFGRGPGLAPAVGVVWEGGGASAGARGTDASLSLQRLAVAFEARLALRRDVFLAARLAPSDAGFSIASSITFIALRFKATGLSFSSPSDSTMRGSILYHAPGMLPQPESANSSNKTGMDFMFPQLPPAGSTVFAIYSVSARNSPTPAHG